MRIVFTARCYAERGIATASRLSVCLFVTSRYRDHNGWNIFNGWNSFKLVSFEYSLFADDNIMDLLPEILAGIGVRYGKVAFGIQKL